MEELLSMASVLDKHDLPAPWQPPVQRHVASRLAHFPDQFGYCQYLLDLGCVYGDFGGGVAVAGGYGRGVSIK